MKVFISSRLAHGVARAARLSVVGAGKNLATASNKKNITTLRLPGSLRHKSSYSEEKMPGWAAREFGKIDEKFGKIDEKFGKIAFQGFILGLSIIGAVMASAGLTITAVNSRVDGQDAKIDGQNAKIEGHHKEIKASAMVSSKKGPFHSHP